MRFQCNIKTWNCIKVFSCCPIFLLFPPCHYLRICWEQYKNIQCIASRFLLLMCSNSNSVQVLRLMFSLNRSIGKRFCTCIIVCTFSKTLFVVIMHIARSWIYELSHFPDFWGDGITGFLDIAFLDIYLELYLAAGEKLESKNEFARNATF